MKPKQDDMRENGNPYMGPKSFTQERKDWFFGRREESDSLFSLLRARQLVLLYSQSGAGKTSLVNAGLIPTLQAKRRGRYKVLPVARVGGESTVTGWQNPYLFNLLASLDIHPSLVDLPHDQRNLSVFLSHLAYDEETKAFVYTDEVTADAAGSRVLIIDQFEELFTQYVRNEAARVSFFKQVAAAMAADPYLYVLISMRDDFAARMTKYVHLLPDRLRSRYAMERLDKASALAAICEPAKMGRRPFATQPEDVAAMFVDCLGRDGDETTAADEEELLLIAAMQLQVVCYELWHLLQSQDEAGNKETITLADVEWAVAKQHVGGGNLRGKTAVSSFVRNALRSYYETAVFDLHHHLQEKGFTESDEHQIRRWFSTQLITEAKTRDLLARMGDETKGMSDIGIEYLDKEKHLVRNEIRRGNNFIELVHDSFVMPILNANEKWQIALEKRLPFLAVAREYARTADDNLLLDDYIKLQAAQKEMADEIAKGGVPPSTQTFLQTYLQKSEKANQDQLMQDIPWLRSAYKYAETKNRDLLFSGDTLQEAIKQADKAKVKHTLPSDVDKFLRACHKVESEKRAARAKLRREKEEEERQQQQELAHQKERAKEAEAASVRQGKLLRIAFGIGVVAFLLAIVAGFFGVDASNSAELAVTSQAAAELGEEKAAVAATTAVAAQIEAENSLIEATIAQGEAEEAKSTVEAAATRASEAEAEAKISEASAVSLRLVDTAEDALQNGSFSSAMLLGLAANQRISAININENNDVVNVKNSVEPILLSSLHKTYESQDDMDLSAMFRASIELPTEVPTATNLVAGFLPNNVATITGDQFRYWSVLEPEEGSSLTLQDSGSLTETIAVVNANTNRLALVNKDNQIAIYALSESINDKAKPNLLRVEDDVELQAMAFSEDGEWLTAVSCATNSITCQVNVWSIIDSTQRPQCSLDLFGATAVTFLNEDTLLVAGFKNQPEMYIIPLSNVGDSIPPCPTQPVPIPEEFYQIDNLAFLPNDDILLGTNGALIQWWRVSQENGVTLERVGSALANNERITAVIPLIDQHGFVLLNEYQQLTWYNADWQLETLSQWACDTTGRDLNAIEWQIAYPTEDIVNIDIENDNNTLSVCSRYHEYPLHISFAEQTLTHCDLDFSIEKARDLTEISDIAKSEFDLWTMQTLMTHFYENEQVFEDNGCWDFVEEAELLDDVEQFKKIATAINNLEVQKSLLDNETYETRIQDEVLDFLNSDPPIAFSDAFIPVLNAQYEAFCLAQGFATACRQLAKELAVDTGSVEADINGTQFWRFPSLPNQLISIELTANSFIPYFDLYDPFGNIIATESEVNDRSTSLNGFFLSAGGTYIIRLIGDEIGLYTIQASTDDPVPITIGDDRSSPETDGIVLWEFINESAIFAQVTMTATDNELGSAIALLDADGIQQSPLSYLDDGFSQIKALYILSPNDNYYIRTTDASGSAINNYALSVESIGAAPITVDNPTTGITDTPQFWQLDVTVDDSGTFIIAMDGVNEFDTVLTLYDANGEVIEYNDDANETLSSEIIKELSAGSYFIHAQGYGGGIGDYQLQVRREE